MRRLIFSCRVLLLGLGLTAPLPAAPESPAGSTPEAAAATTDAIPEKAARYFSQLEKRPSNEVLFERFAEAWLGEKDLDSLAAFLSARAESSGGAAWAMVARLELRSGREAAALAALEKAIAADGKDPVLRLMRARQLLRALDVPAALEDLEVVRNNPEDPVRALEATKLAGQALLRTGQTEKAKALWDEAVARAPEDMELLEDLAEAAAAEGETDTALAYLEKLVKVTADPYEQTMRSLRRADILQQGGRGEEAMDAYGEILARTGEGSWLEKEVLSGMERLFRRRDDAAGLTAHFQALTTQYPARLNLRRHAARLLAANGQPADAVAAYREILKQAPGQREPLLEFIRLLTDADQAAEAAAELEKLAAREPADENLWLQLATLRHRLGEADAARVALAKADALAKDKPGLALRLAAHCLQIGLKEDGESRLRALRDQPAEKSAATEMLASHFQRDGRIDEAVALWTELAAGPDLDPLLRAVQSIAGCGRAKDAYALLRARAGDHPADPAFLVPLVQTGLSAGSAAEVLPAAVDLVRLARQPADLTESIPLAVSVARAAKQSDALLQSLQAKPDRSAPEACLLASLAEAEGNLDLSDQATAGSVVPMVVYHRAALLRGRGNLDGAIEAMKSLADRPDGRSPAYWKELADLQRAAGESEAALATIASWKQSSPNDRAAWLMEASVMEDLGRPDDALPLLRRAVARFEGDADLSGRLAALLAQTGAWAEAESIYWRMHDDSDQPAARLRWSTELAKLAVRSGRTEVLEDRLRERQRTDPKSPAPVLAMAELARAAGDTEKLRDLLMQAVRLQPKDIELRHRIAGVEEEAGNLDRAIAVLEETLPLDATPATTEMLARCFLRNGETVRGLRLLRDRGIGSKDPRALERTLVSLAEKSLVEEAVQLLRDQGRELADDWRLQYLLGWMLEKDGRFAEAEAAYTAVLDARGDLAGVTALPIDPEMGMYGASLPPGTSDLLLQIGILRLADARSVNPYAWGSGSGSVSVNLPDTPMAARLFAAYRLHQLAPQLSDASAAAIPARLARVVDPDVFAFVQRSMGQENDESAKTIREILLRRKDDKRFLFLGLQNQAIASDPEIRGLMTAAFSDSYPEWLLVAEFQMIANNREAKPEEIRAYFQRADALAAKTKEWPEMFLTMVGFSIAQHRGLVNTGETPSGTADPETIAAMKSLSDRFTGKWREWRAKPVAASSNPNMGMDLRFLIDMVAWEILAADKQWAVMAAEMESSCRRHRTGNHQPQDPRMAMMMAMQGGFGVPRFALDEKIPFPFSQVSSVPFEIASRLLPATAEGRDFFGLGGKSRGKEICDGLAAVIDSISHPILRALIRQGQEDLPGMEKELATIDEADTNQRLDAALLRAAKAVEKKQAAEAMTQLTRARAAAMPGLADSIDIWMLHVATDLNPAERAAAGLDARAALLRLARKVAPEQRQELATLATKLGESEVAARMTPRAPSVRSPGGVGGVGPATVAANPNGPSSNPGGAPSGSPKDRLTRLIEEGKTDAAAREACNQLMPMIRDMASGPRYDLRELREKIVKANLVDAVITHADPAGSKSLPKRREFTRVCLLFGKSDRALAQLESLAKDYPKDASILMDLADALPLSEEARILGLWQKVADGKNDLWVERVQAINQSSSATEVVAFWEKAVLFLEKVVPAGESKRNLTWVNHGMLQLLHGSYHAGLPGLGSHTSNDPDGVSPELLKRHQEVFRKGCRVMLRFPGTAEQGFQLLAAAKTIQVAEADLDEAARQVLLSGMVRRKDETRGGLWALQASPGGWSSFSPGDSDSGLISSIEYLASRAATSRAAVLPAAFLENLKAKDADLAALVMDICSPIEDDATARRLLAESRKLTNPDAARLHEAAVFNRLPLTAASLDLVFRPQKDSNGEEPGMFPGIEFTGALPQSILAFLNRLHRAGQSALLESALLRLAEKELGPAAGYGKDRVAFSRKMESMARVVRGQFTDEPFGPFAIAVYSRHRVPTDLRSDESRHDFREGMLRKMCYQASGLAMKDDERPDLLWRFFQDLGMIGVPAADFRVPVSWLWDAKAGDAATALTPEPFEKERLDSFFNDEVRKAILARLQAVPNPGPGEALVAAIISPPGARASHLAAALSRLGSAKSTARPDEINAIGRMIDSLDNAALDQPTVPASLRDNLRAHRAAAEQAAAEARKSLLAMIASDAFSSEKFDEVVATIVPLLTKDPAAAADIFIAAEESLTRGMRSGRLPYLSRPYSENNQVAPLSDRDRLLESIIDDLPRSNDPMPVLAFLTAVVKSPAGSRLQCNESLFYELGRWLIACGIDNSDPAFQNADGHIPFLAARLLKADPTTQAIAAAALTCRCGLLIRGHSDKASTQRLLKGLAQLRPHTPVFIDSIEFIVLATSTAAIQSPELAAHLPDLAGRVLQNPEVPVLLRALRLAGVFNTNGAFHHRAGEFLPMITGLFREYGSGDRSAVTLPATWWLDGLFRGVAPRLPAKDLLPLAEAWHANITSPKAGGHPPLAPHELKISLLLGAFAGHQALVDAHAAMAPDAIRGDYAMLVALADAGMTARIPDFLPKTGGTFHVAKDPLWTAELEKRWAVMRDAVGPEFFARVDAYAAARSDATGASAPLSPWNVRRDKAIEALRANPPRDPMGRLGALNMLSGNFANAVLILPELKAAVAEMDRPALAKELATIARSGQASRDAITRLRVLDAAAGAGIYHGDPDPLLVALSLYQDLIETIRKSPDARDALDPRQIHVLLDRNLRLTSNVLLGVAGAVARPDSRAALAACLPALEQLAVEAHYWPRNGPSPEGRAVLAATLAAQSLDQGARIPPLAAKVQPACTGEFKKIATGDASTRLLESVVRIDDWKSVPFTPHRRAYQQWMLDRIALNHPGDTARVQKLFANGHLSLTGDVQAALDHVPADAPTRGALLVTLAREWQQKKNHAEAEKAFRLAIAANDAASPGAVLALAEHFQNRKAPADARAVLEAADSTTWPADRKKQRDTMLEKLRPATQGAEKK